MAWTPLKAGELRSRITIQHEVRESNGQGGWVTAWTPVATVSAKKIPLRGDEISRDNIQRSVSKARFVIRFRNDISTKHRLIEIGTNKIWNIRNVDDPYGRGDRVELDCESGVPT
mgnify:CR=1 FL=1|jgi:SPP1 family predicted phage head-tail adaptor|tara:strand:- start:5482 stop:5826 length:345 start_codon:yes stop_codon:yes gene_type:complete